MGDTGLEFIQFGVASGVVLLVVDSPLATHLRIRPSHAVTEAVPLLLVGVAYLAWLATERRPLVEMVKQVLIALAFILWGANLLMPPGHWAQFVGGVVIAVYVFDLAWLIEGNLRRQLRDSTDLEMADDNLRNQLAAGICCCGRSVAPSSTTHGHQHGPGDVIDGEVIHARFAGRQSQSVARG